MFDWQVQSREQLGMAIAALSPVKRKGRSKLWLVPSQTGRGRYTVTPDRKKPHCSCRDHEHTGERCKHIFAVQYVMTREQHADGSTTTREWVTVKERVRKTYPQNWPAYNAAQTNEKADFQRLLHDLTKGAVGWSQATGRPRIPPSDALFMIVYKVYSTVSQRRFMCDLRDAHERGYISEVPHFNTISNYMEHWRLTNTLQNLITWSSLPLRSIETRFAADSTGFTTNRFVPWFDKKYRRWDKREHDWEKVHLMCGVKTNIVSACEIHERDASDTKQLPSLMDTTVSLFKVDEVYADKGYSSVNNLEWINQYGATPYIPFKSIHNGNSGGLWAKLYHLYMFNRDEFNAHYNKRQNVETTMMMIKSKFGDAVRSRTPTARKNEVYCKVLCHNICCVIQSMYELGIDPTFSRELAVA